MTIKETNEFMERIKSHYQEFIIDDFKIKEWYKELKNYDYEDINKKLEEHLKSEVYGEQIPKLYFLTKYLIPSEEKGKIFSYSTECTVCGKQVADEEFDNHFKRCSSASAIVRDLKKYYNLNVDYDNLMNMSNETFEKTYIKYLNKMVDAEDLPLFRKKIILKCLYPNIDIDINELIKEM